MISLNKPLSTSGLFDAPLPQSRSLNGIHPTPRGVKAVHPHTPTLSIDPDPSLGISSFYSVLCNRVVRIESEVSPKRRRGACICPSARPSLAFTHTQLQCQPAKGPQDTPQDQPSALGTPRFLFRVFCIVALPKLQAGSVALHRTSDDDNGLGERSCHPKTGRTIGSNREQVVFGRGTFTPPRVLVLFVCQCQCLSVSGPFQPPALPRSVEQTKSDQKNYFVCLDYSDYSDADYPSTLITNLHSPLLLPSPNQKNPESP